MSKVMREVLDFNLSLSPDGEWTGHPVYCPYCTSPNVAVRQIYFDQTCAGCVKRMTERPAEVSSEDRGT